MVLHFVDTLDTFNAINVSSTAMYFVKKDDEFVIMKGKKILYDNVMMNTDAPFDDIINSENTYLKSKSSVIVLRSKDFLNNVILGNIYFNINMKVSLREVSVLSINDFELFALYMRNYNNDAGDDSSEGGSGGSSGSIIDIDRFRDSNTIDKELNDDGTIMFEINEDTMNLINSIVNRVSTVDFKNHLENYGNPHRDKLVNLIDMNIENIKNKQVISYDASKSKYVNMDLPVDELAGKVKLDAGTEGKYLKEFADNSTIIINNGKLCAKKIVGQIVSVAELNTLAGMNTPIKPILETLAAGRGFTGTVASKVELDTLRDMKNGDMKIVTNDESNGNSKFTYIYHVATKEWQPIGVADVNFRDFTVNKLNLKTEVGGLLPQSNMDLTNLVFVNELEKFMKKSIYDADGDGIIDFAKSLYGLVATVKELDSAVDNSHTHTNADFLNTLTAETVGNGVKLSDFADTNSIVVTKIDNKITIALTDKLLAKINNIDNKTDNKDFLTHIEDNNNPHGVNIKSLTDIDFSSMIDQTVLVYDAASDGFKFKTIAGGSADSIKLSDFTDTDSIMVTETDDSKIAISLTDKLSAKINNIDNKTNNNDFLSHIRNNNNPHRVNVKSLSDIDFTNMIDKTALVYDAASNGFKFKAVEGSSDGKVKLTENSDLKYLSETIDNNTIVVEDKKVVAKRLKGQEVSIKEINYLAGLDKPIKEMFNDVSGVQKYTGTVPTKADLDLVIGMENGDMKIVLNDETNGNVSYKYIYNSDTSTWDASGPNDVNVRDFTTDKLDLSKEVKGTLAQSNMNLTGIVKTSDLNGYMKKSVYDVNGNNIVDVAETLTGLKKTSVQINETVEKAHEHNNLSTIEGITDIDGILQYNGVPIATGSKLANSKNAGVLKANAKGAYDVTEVKIDPNTGFLYSEGNIKEVVPDLSICTATVTYPNASKPAINIFKDTGIWGTHIDIGSNKPVMDIDFGETLKFNSITLLGTDYGSIDDIDVYIYNSETTQYVLDISIRNAATHANNLVAYCLTKVYDVQKIRLVFRRLNKGNRYELARLRLYLDKGFGTNPSMNYENISMYESINDYEKLIRTPKIDDIDLTSSSTKEALGIASQVDLDKTTELATHTNRVVIDKFTEDKDGNPLYNGTPIKEDIATTEEINAVINEILSGDDSWIN